jgi:hypothetical protein
MRSLYGDGAERESYNLPTKKGMNPGDAGFFREDTLGAVRVWEVLENKKTHKTKAPGFEGVASDDDADKDFREGDHQASSASEDDDDTVPEGGNRARKPGGPAKKKQRDSRPLKKRNIKGSQKRRVAEADASSNGTHSDDSERDEEDGEEQPAPSKAKPMVETAQARVQSVLYNVGHGHGIFVFAAPKPGDKEGEMCRMHLKYRANIHPGEAFQKDHVSWPRLIPRLPEALTADQASIFEAIAILSCSDSETNAKIAELAKDFKGTVVFPGPGKINHVYARDIFLAAMAYIAKESCEFPRTQELVLAALRVIGNQDEFKQLARSIRPGKGEHRESIPDDLKRFKTVTKLFDPANPLLGELTELYTEMIPTKYELRRDRTEMGGMLLATGRITQAKLDDLKQKEVQQCMRQMAKDLFTDSKLGISTQEWVSVLKQEGRITGPLETELYSMVKAALAMQEELVKTKDKDGVERRFKKTFEYLYTFLPFLQKLVDAVVSSSNQIAGPPVSPRAAPPASPSDAEDSAEEPGISARVELMTNLLMKPQLWGVHRFANMAANELESKYTTKGDAKKAKVLNEYKQPVVQAFIAGKNFRLRSGDDAAKDFSGLIEKVANDLKTFALKYIAKQMKNIPANQRQPSEVLQCMILQGWECACQCKEDGDYTPSASVPNGGGFVLDVDLSGDPDDQKWLKDFLGYIGSLLSQQDAYKFLDVRHISGTAFVDAGKALQGLLDNTEIGCLDAERVIRDALVFIADITGRGDMKSFTFVLNELLDVPVSSYIKKQEVIVIPDDDEPAAGAGPAAQVVEQEDAVPTEKAIKPRKLRVPEQPSVAEFIVKEVKQLMTQNDVRLEGDKWDELLKSTTSMQVARTKFRILHSDSMGEGKYTDLSDGIKTVFRFPTADARVYNIFKDSDKKNDMEAWFKCFCMEIAYSVQRARGKGFCPHDWLDKVRKLFPKKQD